MPVTAVTRRLRYSQFRIENGDAKGGLGIATGHFHVGLFVGNDGKRLGFATGAGRGRNADRGQHGMNGFADLPVVGHDAAIGQQEIDSFGAVHGAAAPDGNEKVGAMAASGFQTRLHMARCGILFHAVEQQRVESCLRQRGQRLLRVSGCFESGIGNEQNTRAAKLAD